MAETIGRCWRQWHFEPAGYEGWSVTVGGNIVRSWIDDGGPQPELPQPLAARIEIGEKGERKDIEVALIRVSKIDSGVVFERTGRGTGRRFSESYPVEATSRQRAEVKQRAMALMEAVERNMGGRREGYRKGQVWSRSKNIEWWLAWELDEDPKAEDYAAEIGVVDPETAVKRWRDTGLDWPPTTDQLSEFDGDG